MKTISHSNQLRQITAISIILLFSVGLNAQLDWTEHLSHDRLTRNNLGFLFEENNLILAMDNHAGPSASLERITGNEQKQVISEFDFNYEARSTFTGLNSKEIMLIKPESLDIYGFGATSIRMADGEISINSLESLIELPCADAIMPLDYNKPYECITNYDFEHLILNSEGEILVSYDASPMILHEGLEENYRVQDGNLYIHNEDEISYLFEVPEFRKLYNNPYTNKLVVVLDSAIIYYDPITFEIEEAFIETEPIAIDFTEDAMYYLSKVNSEYKIFKNYYSGGSNLWMDVDPMPSGQEIEVKEISIKGLDSYLFGIHYNELTKTSHHIVQKQNLLSPIGPPRKDLAILTFTASYEEVEFGKYEYTYDIVIANNGTSVVNTFNVYSDIQEFNELYFTNINQTFNGILQPGEEVTLNGSFIAKSMSKININIPGADYMFDSYPNDNSGTFDLISSTNDALQSNFEFSPNPTTGIINLQENRKKNTQIHIIDIYGRRLMSPNIKNNKIDLSNLSKGQYYIQFIDENKVTTKSIVKI